MVESGFQQFVNFATRNSNILDLVFTDDEQIIHSITHALLDAVIMQLLSFH